MRLVIVLLFAGLMAVPSAGQSILDRRYTSDKLDRFWQETLGVEAPDPARFEILAPGDAAAEPMVEAPPDLGVPFIGDVIGESAGGGQPGRRVGFPVIPLSPDDAAVLVRRLAWSEIYLNRYRFFEAVSTDTADILGILTARQHSAALEAHLITARLYFAAPDLQEKCTRLRRLEEIATGPLADLDPDAPLPDWQPLVPIHAATSERLDQAALAQFVCSVEPVRGRGEMVQLMETRVRERIVQEVRDKVDDTLQLLEAASAEFQALVNEMDVPIASAEVLELERVLGNARANMLLVKEDQLKAAETIETLQETDLSSLDQPTQLAEFQDGQTRMTAMIRLIEEVLAALAGLEGISEEPDLAEELAPCATLRGAYAALDLTRDTDALTRQITEPYEDCISRARQVVTRFQEPSLQKALMAELARDVRQISETYLATVGP